MNKLNKLTNEKLVRAAFWRENPDAVRVRGGAKAGKAESMNQKSSDVRIVFSSPIRLMVKSLTLLVQAKRKSGEITLADNAEYDAVKTAALALNVWYD